MYCKELTQLENHNRVESCSNNTIGKKRRVEDGLLTKEMIDKLHTVALNVNLLRFTDIHYEQSWNHRVEELKAFIKENGHTDVP